MILHKNNNRYAARQGAVGEYVKRDISIGICIVYIDILHILVAACPHFVTPLPLLFLPVLFPYILWLVRASWKCYQFFTIYINTEIFLRSSVSFMSPRCPFPAQLHLQLRIVILLLGTGLRILIFDKRTGNLSPVSVRRGAARLPPQPSSAGRQPSGAQRQRRRQRRRRRQRWRQHKVRERVWVREWGHCVSFGS